MQQEVENVSVKTLEIDEKQTSSRSYDLVDLFKFIASILILSMHSGALFSFGENVQFIGQLLARWGVPFFFTVSAFFLFSKSENGNITKTQLLKYVKRIAILYLVWVIFNIPYIVDYLLARDITDINTWWKFLRSAVVADVFIGSWYLVSSMFSAWLVFLLSKKLKTKWVLLIAFIIYVPCVLTSAYANLMPSGLISGIKTVFGAYLSITIFGGVFFVALGKFIAEKFEKISRIIPKWVSFALFIVFFALYFLEMILLKNNGVLGYTDSSFLLIPVAFFLVVFALTCNVKIKFCAIFRKASTIIYCSQSLIISMSRLVMNTFNITHSFYLFALCVVITAVLITAILLLARVKSLKFMKYFT